MASRFAPSPRQSYLAMVVAFCAVGVVAGWVLKLSIDQRGQTNRNRRLVARIEMVRSDDHRNLCAVEAILRAREKQQLEQSNKFLHDHPAGGFGFTAAEIAQGIVVQEARVAALTDPSCKKQPTGAIGSPQAPLPSEGSTSP